MSELAIKDLVRLNDNQGHVTIRQVDASIKYYREDKDEVYAKLNELKIIIIDGDK